jgi:DNA-damage-inducible protein J
MTTTSMNIRTDSEVKKQAEELFEEFGLNMTTAVNMFLRQAVRERRIPFSITLKKQNENIRPPFEYESMKGKVWMPDDFNAPLDDMKEYME